MTAATRPGRLENPAIQASQPWDRERGCFATTPSCTCCGHEQHWRRADYPPLDGRCGPRCGGGASPLRGLPEPAANNPLPPPPPLPRRMQAPPLQQKPWQRKAFQYAAYAFWPMLVVWVIYSYPSGGRGSAAARLPAGAVVGRGGDAPGSSAAQQHPVHGTGPTDSFNSGHRSCCGCPWLHTRGRPPASAPRHLLALGACPAPRTPVTFTPPPRAPLLPSLPACRAAPAGPRHQDAGRRRRRRGRRRRAAAACRRVR